jgi:hypothetical protein
MKKILIFLIFSFVVVIVSACSKVGSTAPTTCQVYYTVTGNMSMAGGIVYTRPDGNMTDVGSQTLPYTSPTQTFSVGSTVFIEAISSTGSGNVTVNIYEDGKLFKTNSGPDGSATVQGSL